MCNSPGSRVRLAGSHGEGSLEGALDSHLNFGCVMGHISRDLLPSMLILLMGLENRAQPIKDGRLETKTSISEAASLRGQRQGLDQ